MNFGEALAAMKGSETVHAHRAGWNGKNMWIAIQTPTFESKMSMPYIYMQTACGNLVPWLASQTDLLAEDWIIKDGLDG